MSKSKVQNPQFINLHVAVDDRIQSVTINTSQIVSYISLDGVIDEPIKIRTSINTTLEGNCHPVTIHVTESKEYLDSILTQQTKGK